MLSLLYIVIAVGVGWQITEPLVMQKGIPARNPIWVRMASSFAVGVLVMTWPLYLAAFVLHVVFSVKSPLGPANAIVLVSAALFLVFSYISSRKYGKLDKESKSDKKISGLLRESGLITDYALFRKEAVFYLIVLAFVWFSFNYVLHMDGTKMKIGYTVFGDYSPNISLIRSFSWFPNYPTEYPFFAGQDIKYHFMFMFFNGNMEYLGLPLAFAYNLTSALSLFGFYVMLTQLALRVTGRFSAAVLTAVFFTFRSGLAVFIFIKEHLAAGDLARAFAENTTFIGYTTSENWGLWNFNVYLNQRHLGFGLVILSLVLWHFLGYIEEACSRGRSDQDAAVFLAEDRQDGQARSNVESDQDATLTAGFTAWFKEFFLSKEAWLPKAPDLALLAGIVLGLCSFWNGACVIGGLLILAGFAVFSKNKVDYVILAAASILLASLQTKAFISGSAVTPTFYLGFISGTTKFAGMVGYLTEITGVTIVGSLVAVFAVNRKERIFIAANWLLVIFTFTISLTPDVTVNHKYIMIAMAYLSIIWGELVSKLFSERTGERLGWRGVSAKTAAAVLVFFMIATGVYDYTIIMRDNDRNHCITLDLNHDLTTYIRQNLTYDDMVLSGEHALTELTLSGIRIYSGWPYYAWSAGYDTNTRCGNAQRMYTEMDAEEIREMMRAEGINYVLYEQDMKYEDVPAREEPFKEVCDLVFTSSDGFYRLYRLR